MGRSGYRPSLSTTTAVVLASILVGFLLTLPGPLRLDTDAGIYLQLAASVADGTGLHPPGSQTMPPGYPLMLGGLDRLGGAGPVGFTLLALAFLALALAASAVVCTVDLGMTRMEVAVMLVATALSVYVIKYVSVPASELPFFGVSSAALAALALARRRASLWWLLGGIGLVGAACTIRTAGVALGAAVALAPARSVVRRITVVAVTVVGALVVVAAPYALSTDRWTNDPVGTARDELWRMLVTSGSVAANVPLSGLGRSTVERPMALVGLVALGITMAVLASRRRTLRPVDGYVAATLAMILLFPYEHPRFYLPIVPFVIGYMCIAARRVPLAGKAAAAVFCAVGLVALGYSVVLTYSGNAFPERYAGGELASTYRVAWGVPRPGDEATVAPKELAALRRYDPEPPLRWTRTR